MIAPVADLVRMKLTSFRLKDKVHIQDLDGVGLITPEIEAVLSRCANVSRKSVRLTNVRIPLTRTSSHRRTLLLAKTR